MLKSFLADNIIMEYRQKSSKIQKKPPFATFFFRKVSCINIFLYLRALKFTSSKILTHKSRRKATQSAENLEINIKN